MNSWFKVLQCPEDPLSHTHSTGLFTHTVYLAISVKGHTENWEDLGGTKTSRSSQGLSSKAGSSHSKEAQVAGGPRRLVSVKPRDFLTLKVRHAVQNTNRYSAKSFKRSLFGV